MSQLSQRRAQMGVIIKLGTRQGLEEILLGSGNEVGQKTHRLQRKLKNSTLTLVVKKN
jgi:hypothetical protein